MRARHRHFNPSAAGAVCVLDSRYINQSNSTAVAAWSDRSGNAYNAAQGTAASQPTFLTNQQASNGAVSFDGSNDFMEFASFASLTDFSFFVTATIANNRDIALIEANNGTLRRGLSWGGIGTGTGPIVVYGSNRYRTTTSSHLNAWKIFQSDSGPTVRVDETSLTLSAEQTGGAGTSNLRRIGRLALAFNEYVQGSFAQVLAFGSNLAAPLRKRTAHASAFSFKIACN